MSQVLMFYCLEKNSENFRGGGNNPLPPTPLYVRGLIDNFKGSYSETLAHHYLLNRSSTHY